MADIHIVTVGDRRKFKAGVRVALKAIAPPGTSEFGWARNNKVLADAASNQYFVTMGPETAGYYTVRANVGGVIQTSDAIRISLDDAADEPVRAVAPATISGGAGGSAPAPEKPPTYRSGFAFVSAVVFLVFGVVLSGLLAFLGSRVLSDQFWSGLEGRLKIAVVLGLPATIVGLVVIFVGLWMAVVEWRGRLRAGDATVAHASLSAGDVKEIIAAVGSLRGAALVLVVGALLMLGTAWVAQSAAGTASPGAGTTTPVTPARTAAPGSTSAPAGTTAPTP